MRATTCFLGILVLSLVACGNSFRVRSTAGLTEFEDEPGGEYDYRATTADVVVLGVREIDNDPQGNLDFWTQAVRNRVRDLGGYELVRETSVRAASGQQGKQLQFAREQDGRPYVYWVTLFVTEDTIYVLEAGGIRESWQRDERRIREAIAGFRIT